MACDHLARIDREKKSNEKSECQRAMNAHKLRQTIKEVNRTSKRCPKAGCQAPTQRSGGWAHMICPRCNTRFCWACKVIWGAEAQHLDTCVVAVKRKTTLEALDTTAYAEGWRTDPDYDASLDTRLWIISNEN